MARYLTVEEITDHLTLCTRAGLSGGFHCIGDAAVSAAVSGLLRVADQLGVDAVRRARHRLEHVEMVTPAQIATLARLGVAGSVQPAFDAAWGGPNELYEQRLGRRRAATMNPLADWHRSGGVVAYGTDAPVTPLAGWAHGGRRGAPLASRSAGRGRRGVRGGHPRRAPGRRRHRRGTAGARASGRSWRSGTSSPARWTR